EDVSRCDFSTHETKSARQVRDRESDRPFLFGPPRHRGDYVFGRSKASRRVSSSNARTSAASKASSTARSSSTRRMRGFFKATPLWQKSRRLAHPAGGILDAWNTE